MVQRVEGQRYQGKVKWFNPNKGYGFITLGEEGEDIFVHQNELNSESVKTLLEDQAVEFTYVTEEGKPKAKEITGPHGTKLVKPHKSRLNPQWAKRLEGTDIKLGSVKWFDSKKGYGFLFHENGEGEVFVHNSQITSSGFRALAEGQDVEFKLIIDASTDGIEQQKATEVTGPGGHPVVPPLEAGRGQNSGPLIGGMGMGMGMGMMMGMPMMRLGGNGMMGQPSASGKHTGAVKWFNPEKGFGFIVSGSSPKDIFAHQTEIKSTNGQPGVLQQGQIVEFTVQTKNGQPRACGITVTDMSTGQLGKRKANDPTYQDGNGKVARSGYPQDFQTYAQFSGYTGAADGSGRQGFDPYSGAYYAQGAQGAGHEGYAGYSGQGGQQGAGSYGSYGSYYQ